MKYNEDNIYQNLLETYIDIIKNKFNVENNNGRISLIRQLEEIVGKVEFDFKKVRKIREDKRFSRVELAKILEAGNSTICKYELGDVVPSSKGKTGRKYLEWLKEQGYNPFNI